MSNSKKFKQRLLGLSTLGVLACAFPAGAAYADDTQVALNTANTGGADIETVVITGRKFNPEVAPSKASLDTMQPQTIISQSYIQDSVAPTADYVTILAIVPSLTGQSINGPGLSDGNVKNTLRGLPDGDFNMSYDGIPFGDTNGPTHHSESYFPAPTIGGADVDRGPGNAGNLGAASFGGSIYLYSEPLIDDSRLKEEATYGSWDTWFWNTNVQTGAIDDLDGTKALFNFELTGSNGYLTDQSTHRDNELFKTETDIAPGWTLTFFTNRNGLHQVVNDNNGATPAQIVAYGKQFALQNTNPALPNYAAYNHEDKYTDMDYVRLKGEVTSNFHVDDQAYTYAYVNKTVTTSNIEQTATDITNGITEGLGTKTGSTQGPATAKNPIYDVGSNIVGGSVVGGTSHATDIPGYTKLNAYRVWGNILRTSYDFGIGGTDAELRVGVWAEGAATERRRFYFDVTQCFAAANAPCNIFQTEWSGTYGDSSQKKGTFYAGIPGVGYLEHSGWSQYEPFAELELHPFDGLTVTPGVKYVWWQHDLDAAVISGSKPPTPFLMPGNFSAAAAPNTFTATGKGSFTTTRTLPFAEVNYKIEPYWSVYFQYANGIYVPDISAFEQAGVVSTFPKPQTTTNYQFGSVYYSDNFTIDADIYYIDSNNTIGTITGTGLNGCPAQDVCNTNLGVAFYKGVEGEATYAFDENAFDGLLDGLAVFTNGSINSARSRINPATGADGEVQLGSAPFWTAAGGLIYKLNGWKLSLIDKATGQQYQDNPNKRVDASGNLIGTAAYSGTSFYKLPAYNTLDFTGSYDLGNYFFGGDYTVGFGVYNVLDSRSILSMTINDSPPANGSAGLASNYAARPGSTDQYFFQPARMFQVTLKATF